MANVVFARKTTVVGAVTVRHGDAWDADSEMVKTRPDLFADRPTKVATGGPRGAREIREGGQVETATKRPGEKRKTPRKKTSPATSSEDDD